MYHHTAKGKGAEAASIIATITHTDLRHTLAVTSTRTPRTAAGDGTKPAGLHLDQNPELAWGRVHGGARELGVVIVISPYALRSQAVLNEIQLAFETGRRIIPKCEDVVTALAISEVHSCAALILVKSIHTSRSWERSHP
jgi:hypothetical protein